MTFGSLSPGKIIRWLVEPSSTIREPDRRRQAKLLSTTLLLLSAFGFLLIGIGPFVWSDWAISSVVIPAPVLLTALYLLSRTRHHHVTTVLTICLIDAAIIGEIALLPYGTGTIVLPAFLLIGVLLASTLLPTRVSIIIIALHALISVLLPGLFPEIDQVWHQFSYAITLVLVISGLIILWDWNRDLLEADRQRELSRLYERSRRINEELEEKVQERTAELSISNEQIRNEMHENQHLLDRVVSSEKLLRQVIDSTNDWIWATDRDSRYILANQAVAAQFGLTPDQMLEKRSQEMDIPQHLLYGDEQENREGYLSQDNTILATGQSLHKPLDVYPLPDGSERIQDIQKMPLFDADGSIIGILGIAHDITESEQNRRRQQGAYALGQRLNSLLNDTQALLGETVTYLNQTFNYYHAHIYLLDKATQNLVVHAGIGEAGEELTRIQHAIPLNSERGLVPLAARTLEPVVVNDVAANPDHLPNSLLPETRSEVAIPISIGMELIGVLDAQQNIVGHFNEDEVRTLRIIANQLAVALSNARLFTEIGRSEELVRTVIDASPDWIWVKNRDFRYILLNKAFAEQALNSDPAEILGKNDNECNYQLFVDGDFDQRIQQFRVEDMAVFEGETVHFADEHVSSRDGNMRIRDTWKFPLRDKGGTIIGSLGISRDITEQKRGEQSLRESEEYFRFLFEASPDATLLIDPHHPSGEWPIVACNQIACAMNGYTMEEMIGQPIDMLNLNKSDEAAHKAYYERLRAAGILKAESEHVRKDGVVISIQTNTALISYQGRELVVGIDRDITAQKQTEALIAQARDQALEASRQKSHFVANMSHELRTPLNSIIGFGQILVDGLVGELNAQQNEFTMDILSSAQHLLGLISDVLDMSKIEAGQMIIHPAPFDFKNLSQETVEVIQGLVEKRQQNLVIEIPDDLPPLNADAFRIKQVLLNLLSNAHKFTLAQGTITLRAELIDTNSLLIQVKDTGPGIEDKDLDLIFREFRQVDNTTTREVGGTGLGLPISRRLTEMHGGIIWVDSTPGVGSTFSLLLPLAGPTGQEAHVLASINPENVPIGSVEHPLILVAESDRNYANILSFNFSQEGYNVIHLSDDANLIEQARALKPEIISLDVNLHGKNGFQILRELKAQSETQHIPVIMIAAVEHRQMGLDLGVASFLVKPSSAEELRKALSDLKAKDMLAPAKVMVVDDEPEVGYMLDMLLSSADFQFSLMYNPFTALDTLVASPPDIVVVDLTMPVMDGFEFVRRVRDHAHLQDLPIIVFTATMVVGDDAKFLRAHVQAIVQKGGLSNIRALAAELHRLRKGSLASSTQR